MAMAIQEEAVLKPSLPLRTRISLYLLSTITDYSCRPDGTMNRRVFHLLDYCRIRVPPNPNPRNGVKTSDVTVDSSRGLWFRLFVPTTQHSQNLPVIVFFHGGGFAYLAPDFHGYDAVCRRFARHVPAVVVSVNYRLAPEHHYPAQYNDGFDVLEFLDKEKDRILPENADVSRCFLAGDSAGGNLAHHVAIRACRSAFTHLKVMGVVAIQPFFGGEERTKAETELAEVDLLVSINGRLAVEGVLPEGNRDHQVINVSGPNAEDISKLDFPATMVVVAGFDSLKDWQRKYYEWLKRSGKEAYLLEYPTMIHAFYIFPELPESKHLILEASRFIHNQCSKLE
ncbi:putative carboxylesterase 18-like [Dorcoceras hygrometricum]|uniref:Putative carboxylesterase 18-like n=1 Tax=Dorcoceras hygrometricum TaxID=472368 RepID=A0A2Z7CL52_9LAMI|nr:putative carboxylesterase 18-like [Dorcoceras hygrometricum]